MGWRWPRRSSRWLAAAATARAQPENATSAWEAEADQRHAAEASRTSAVASASRAAAASSASASPSAAAAAAAAEAARTVVYSVTSDGSATGSSTYASFTGGGMHQAQDTNAALPWSKILTLSGEMNIMSLVAQASSGASDQSISCSISRGGRVIATNTSTGGYAVVTCSA